MSAEGEPFLTSACKYLGHSFQVTCQQIHRKLKMWWTNRRIDRWTNYTHWHRFQLRVSHLDTSAYKYFRLFLLSDLSANTQKPESVMNEQTDWPTNNTHRHRHLPRLSHLDISACKLLCHSFYVICQEMFRNLKMWWTDEGMNEGSQGIHDHFNFNPSMGI